MINPYFYRTDKDVCSGLKLKTIRATYAKTKMEKTLYLIDTHL